MGSSFSDMRSHERIAAVLSFQPVDRLPVVEWATWWNLTLERWRGEGLPDDADPAAFFGLDRLAQFWFPLHDPDALPRPVHHGAPLLSTMDEYEHHREHMFHFDGPLTFPEERFRAALAGQDAGECAVWFTFSGFFWFARVLLGIEPHLYSFYDCPELVHRINRDLSGHMLRLIDRMRPLGRPVFMTFAEDMSYNHGPMISRELFDEFMLPYYRRVVPALREWGVVPLVDSDGDVTEPMGWFEAAGLAGVLPLERQAGVDVAELRRRYPGQCLVGGFDKMTMHLGAEAMRAEWERLLPTARLGGFIPSVDHQTPPAVSMADYRQYVALSREYAERAATPSGV